MHVQAQSFRVTVHVRESVGTGVNAPGETISLREQALVPACREKVDKYIMFSFQQINKLISIHRNSMRSRS